MKTLAILILVSSVAFGQTQTASDGQRPEGFQLPLLQPGQTLLTLAPHYTRRPVDDSTGWSRDTQPVMSQFSGTSHELLYRFDASFLYGLTDKTTVMLSGNITPHQETGSWQATRIDNELYDNPRPSQLSYRTSGTSEQQSFHGALAIGHRLTPGSELSLTLGVRESRVPRSSVEESWTWSGNNIPPPATLRVVDHSYMREITASPGWGLITGKDDPLQFVRPEGFRLPRPDRGALSLSFGGEIRWAPSVNTDSFQEVVNEGGSQGYSYSSSAHGDGWNWLLHSSAVWGLADNLTASAALRFHPALQGVSSTEHSTWRVVGTTSPPIQATHSSAEESQALDLAAALAFRPASSVEFSLAFSFLQNRDAREVQGPWFWHDYDIYLFGNLTERYEVKHRQFAVEFAYSLSDLTGNRLPAGLQAGYLLPPLLAGEHLVQLGVSYAQEARDELDYTPTPAGYYSPGSMLDSRRTRSWRLDLTGSYYWGLADDLTLLFDAGLAPPHQAGSSWRFTNRIIERWPEPGFFLLPYDSYMRAFEDRQYLLQQSWREWSWRVGLTCSYRPLRSLELAVSGAYDTSREPMEGSLLFRYSSSYSRLEQGASTLDTRNFAFNLRIALLPY